MKKIAPKAPAKKAAVPSKVPAKTVVVASAAAPKAAAKTSVKPAPVKILTKAVPAKQAAKTTVAVDRITPHITSTPAKVSKPVAAKVVAKAPAKAEKAVKPVAATPKGSVPASKVATPAKAMPAKTPPVSKTNPVKVAKGANLEIGPTAPVPGSEALFVFENIEPTVDMGLFPAKREVGDILEVRADVLRHFHEKFTTWFEIRIDGGTWTRHDLTFIENDRWGGSCPRSGGH